MLTHKQILKLEAGPEMRRLIAVHVFGWTLYDDYEVWIDGDGITEIDYVEWWMDENGDDLEGCGLPRWDADWNAMREVIEKVLAAMPEGERYYSLEYSDEDDAPEQYQCGLPDRIYGYAPTLPVAVGRAALLWALEKENEHGND